MHKSMLSAPVLAISLLLSFSCPAFAARIIYVDDDAAGSGDGSSWNTAYRFLHDALADANGSPKPVEVWVAQGVYRPDRSASHPNGTGDRTAAFQLTGSVTVKGGYAGLGQQNPDTRDIAQYTTTLSGDLAGNDIQLTDPADLPSEPTRADNSCNVVTAAGCDRATLIEGFTITAGNATGPILSGGGIYNGKPTVSLCTIVANSASTGGGIYFEHAAHEPGALLKDSIITHNSANSGGGVYGCAEVVNCTFTDNTAVDGYAGALNLGSDCETTVTNCTFSRNYAAEGAGAVYLDASGTEVTFTRCAFVANSSGARGGAIFSDGCTCGSYPTFYQCRFTGNNAAGNGGAICDYGFTDTQLYNCLLTGNSSGGNGGALCDEYDGGSALINCTVSNNTAAGQGGGICYDRYSYKGRRLANTIIWANSDRNGQTHQYSQIYLIEVSELQDVTHCCIQVIPPGIKGQGNITSNPLFVDIDGPDNIPGNGDDNLHLLEGSACIDTGHNEYLPPQAIDLDGKPRINGIVDRGAYEYSPQHSRIIYVDDSATGLSTGTSWKDAFKYLQFGILTALAGDEIRVAQGTYRPNEGIVADVPDDRALTFQLRNGVTIKGGYAGFGSANPDARDIHRYISVLSGDLAGNDGANFVHNHENGYRVVTGSGTDPTAVLDGVTITGGNANYEDFSQCNGAGMYNYRGSPTVLNCTFIGNFAGNGDGGGMGGAMHNENGSPSVTNCSFIRNAAIALDGGEGVGGAMSNWHSSPTIVNCTFTNNVAGRDGGAIWNYESHPTLRNCLLTGNLAREGGSGSSGGGIWSYGGSASLVNCTFAANVARSSHIGDAGGGIYCERLTELAVLNCIFRDNTAGQGPQIALHFCDAVSLSHSNIQGAEPSVHAVSCSNLHWGPANIDNDPLFANPGYWDPNGTPEDARDDFWVNGDYHLESQAGRWQPADNSQFTILNSQLPQGSWVQDNVTSPCIDAGDPMSSIGLEPFPNGGRINMGDFGGTAEAGKSWFGGPVCETIIAGDINGDCEVDFSDFTIMALHWLNDYSSDVER